MVDVIGILIHMIGFLIRINVVRDDGEKRIGALYTQGGMLQRGIKS